MITFCPVCALGNLHNVNGLNIYYCDRCKNRFYITFIENENEYEITIPINSQNKFQMGFIQEGENDKNKNGH